MSAWAISLIVFACISGGALFGMFLHSKLPEHHLGPDAKEVVRLGMGLIATIAALVLSLLIAGAKTTFDTKSAQITQLAANAVLLDNLLGQYGAQTNSARNLMRRAVVTMSDRIWHENSTNSTKTTPFEGGPAVDALYQNLQSLAPANDAQRSLKDQAIQISSEIARTRFLLFVEAEAENSIPLPFLAVLVFWLMIIFASFSLFAQPSGIVVSCLFIFAASAAAAIFLILELAQPFAGLMQISSEPLRNALSPLGP